MDSEAEGVHAVLVEGLTIRVPQRLSHCAHVLALRLSILALTDSREQSANRRRLGWVWQQLDSRWFQATLECHAHIESALGHRCPLAGRVAGAVTCLEQTPGHLGGEHGR